MSQDQRHDSHDDARAAAEVNLNRSLAVAQGMQASQKHGHKYHDEVQRLVKSEFDKVDPKYWNSRSKEAKRAYKYALDVALAEAAKWVNTSISSGTNVLSPRWK